MYLCSHSLVNGKHFRLTFKPNKKKNVKDIPMKMWKLLYAWTTFTIFFSPSNLSGRSKWRLLIRSERKSPCFERFRRDFDEISHEGRRPWLKGKVMGQGKNIWTLFSDVELKAPKLPIWSLCASSRFQLEKQVGPGKMKLWLPTLSTYWYSTFPLENLSQFA